MIVLLLTMYGLTLTASGQPFEGRRSPFEAVKTWQVELDVEFNEISKFYSSKTTTHVTSKWKGLLTHEEMWTDPSSLDVLPWTGNLDVTVEGTKVIVHDSGVRKKIDTQGKKLDPSRPFFGIYIGNNEYYFLSGYVNLSELEEVSQSPGQPEHKDPYGSIGYSPGFRVVRPLPERVAELSGTVALDSQSPDQPTPLRPGEKVTITWKIKPTAAFTCGPDVTKATQDALTEMESFFKNDLNDQGRVTHCEALNILPGALIAWEITELYYGNASWLDAYTKAGKCCVPGDGKTDDNEDPATCKHSVRHSNRCVLAGTLNYFAFGQMNRLCYDYALQTSDLRASQLECLVLMGSCSLPGGLPSQKQLEQNFETCRSKTAYPGPPFQPNPDECRYRRRILDPSRWDKASMRSKISAWKGYGLVEDPEVPIAFAEAAFDQGAAAIPPVENRAQCKGTCGMGNEEDKNSLPWKWCPDHACPKRKWIILPSPH